MSDKRVQRPQDYEALAEECRRLAAENAGLKRETIKPKPSRTPGAFRQWMRDRRRDNLDLFMFGILAAVVLVGLLVVHIWSTYQPTCFSAVPPPSDQLYRGWYVSKSNGVFVNTVKSELTEEQAREFLAKWKLKECR